MSVTRDQKRQILTVFFQPLRRILGAPADGPPTPDGNGLRRAAAYFCGTARFPEQLLLLWLANLGRIGMPDRTALATMFAPGAHEDTARLWLVSALVLARSGFAPLVPPFRAQAGCREQAIVEWLFHAACGQPPDASAAPVAADAELAQRLVLQASQMLHILGCFEAADALAGAWCARARELEDDGGTLHLNWGHFLNIGHYVITAAVIQFARSGRLRQSRVAVEEGPVANAYLRAVFEPFLSPGPATRGLVESICGNRLHRLADGGTLTASRLMSEAARAWFEDRPFLGRDPDLVERGWELLERHGIARGTPLVTLHVREARWKADLGNFLHYGSRNADLASYLPAIRRLVAKGAAVIRLGDAGMTPAPALPGLLDYPHSALKADWMDVFLVSQCLFHIGTSSGMSLTPLLFGKPTLLTNWSAFDEMLDPPNAVTIFKVLRDMSGRAVPFEALSRGRGYLRYLMDLAAMGCFPEDNDAADILDAVDFLAGCIDWRTGALAFPAGAFDASDAAFAASSFGIRPRIAPGFWRRHFAGIRLGAAG